MFSKKNIMQALSRGYYKDNNTKKQLDSKLILSMTNEILKLQKERYKQIKEIFAEL